MTAITRNGTELGHLTLIEIVRITSAPDHERYLIPSWLDEFYSAFEAPDEFTSQQVADHFIRVGMPDWGPEFHAMRGGEALGAAIDCGWIESTGPDAWRWIEGDR